MRRDEERLRVLARGRAVAGPAAGIGRRALPHEPGSPAHVFPPRGPARAGHRRRARGHGRRDTRGGAFSVERRPLDLLLAAGFFTAGMGTLAFSVVPVLGGAEQGAPEAWAAVVSRAPRSSSPRRWYPSAAGSPRSSRARPCRSRRSLRSGPPCTHGETVSVRWTRPGTATPSSSPWRWPSSPSSPSSP